MQIISLMLGLVQLAKGVASIVNVTRKSLILLKRYGKNGLKQLKKLDKKQLKEVFEDLDEQKPPKIKLKTKKMESYFLGEETGINPNTGGRSWCYPKKVIYLDDAKNLKYKVKIVDQRLIDSKGQLIDTSDAGTLFTGKGRAIFVMDDNGSIFVSKFQERHLFHHSSLLSGKPVSSAGEIKIIEGVIKEISIKSGHYQPSPSLNKQILLVLKEFEIETKNIVLIN